MMRRAKQPSKPTSNTAAIACYHCGELVPGDSDYQVTITGEPQPMCCPGCRAVATLIADSGLESFYRHRTALNSRPDLVDAETPQHYGVFDEASVNRAFTDQDEQGLMHTRLLLGGISCAACTWLIEQTLLQDRGVHRAAVNLGQSRLDVSFDPRLISLSQIFQRVDALGYKTRPFARNTQLEQLARDQKTNLRQLAVAGLGMMQVGMFAIALHAGDIQGMEAQYQSLLRWVSLLVASFVVFYSSRTFFEAAWRHLRAGSLVMDLPVSLAIALAWLASIWATITGGGQVYFDSVVMFTFFLLLGRFLERRARSQHKLLWFNTESSLPVAVKVQRRQQWQTVARQTLKVDEIILIPQGSTVPVDVEILSGTSDMDERTFNGEHRLRQVAAGDTVFAGTVSATGALQARIIATCADTRLAALQRSVEYAQGEKPAIAQLADRIAAHFIAFVLVVTVATACTWLVLDPSRALWISLSVLVVSCPCALALATPAALTAAANGLRRSGVIVRGENAIEALAGTSHLIFDKTGTLTRGQFELCDVVLLGTTREEEILQLAAALQLYSNHPLARAFAEVATQYHFDSVKYCVGEGLEGSFGNQLYRLGSMNFCRQLADDLTHPPAPNRYWIALCREGEPLAWLGLEDNIRAEACKVVSDAQGQGLVVELLTGDSSTAGAELANTLGIARANTGYSPEEKMAHVQQLQHSGAIVSMVGDGLNDAPVLGVADASFAVAAATDLARTQADFILTEDNLGGVLTTWSKARWCRSIIRQNLAWALTYNLCGIPLAATGYIAPWAAAIGMSASSLLVVLNSLRLNRQSRTSGLSP
jgi:P-type Cu2+ transporter